MYHGRVAYPKAESETKPHSPRGIAAS